METIHHFTFGGFETSVHVRREIPHFAEITADIGGGFCKPLIICDEHTVPIADSICDSSIPRCVLRSGETHKNWDTVETILRAAHNAGLGRDSIFVGVGGGVIGDLSAFAASIYMRGCGFVLISTTLLGMVDASVGGKTGFNLCGLKNLIGTFYPARYVYIPMESLASLPIAEWKSGMAELIKTAVLEGDDFLDELMKINTAFPSGSFTSGFPADFASRLLEGDEQQLERCVNRAVKLKGDIVQSDPRETGTQRIFLNLGHTFGHALEAVAGLGTVSHGEAVAWGIICSCEMGLSLGITPPARAEKIKNLLVSFGYETAIPHPLMNDAKTFMKVLRGDKKRRGDTLTFIVPDETSARSISVNDEMIHRTLSF